MCYQRDELERRVEKLEKHVDRLDSQVLRLGAGIEDTPNPLAEAMCDTNLHSSGPIYNGYIDGIHQPWCRVCAEQATPDMIGDIRQGVPVPGTQEEAAEYLMARVNRQPDDATPNPLAEPAVDVRERVFSADEMQKLADSAMLSDGLIVQAIRTVPMAAAPEPLKPTLLNRPQFSPEPRKPGPTCREFAQAIGMDQAKAMGIPLTDEPLNEWQSSNGPIYNGYIEGMHQLEPTPEPRKPTCKCASNQWECTVTITNEPPATEPRKPREWWVSLSRTPAKPARYAGDAAFWLGSVWSGAYDANCIPVREILPGEEDEAERLRQQLKDAFDRNRRLLDRSWAADETVQNLRADLAKLTAERDRLQRQLAIAVEYIKAVADGTTDAWMSRHSNEPICLYPHTGARQCLELIRAANAEHQVSEPSEKPLVTLDSVPALLSAIIADVKENLLKGQNNESDV